MGFIDIEKKNEAMRDWRHKNPEKIKAYKESYEKRYPGKRRKYMREYMRKYSKGLISKRETDYNIRNKRYRGQVEFRNWKKTLLAGCCVICFEDNPFVIENHHLFGKDSDLQVPVCANCHTILTRLSKSIE